MASGGSLSLRRRSRPLINLNGIPFRICTSSPTFLPSVPLILHSDKSSILQKVVFFTRRIFWDFAFLIFIDWSVERGASSVGWRRAYRKNEKSEPVTGPCYLHLFIFSKIFKFNVKAFHEIYSPTFVFRSPLRSGGWMPSICESKLKLHNVTVTDLGRDAECLALNWREKR